MRVLTQLEQLGRVRQPVILAAGFFDGVHRGHACILRRCIEKARAARGQAWAMTFDPHPLKVLNPDAAPPLLTCTGHKLRILERMGLDGCLVLPFTRAFAATEPEDFVARLLACRPLAAILVGRNWRFGRRGRGDPALLAGLCRGRKVAVTVVRALAYRGETISSTRVRAAVQQGNLDDAAAMLGRPYSIFGTVVHGRGIGRGLGFPTANLDPHNEVLPPAGVYAARCLFARRPAPGGQPRPEIWPAAVNLGSRPTFETAGRVTLEAHVLDLRGNLYGRNVEVFLAERLRGEIRFASAETLRRRIARDAEEARRILSTPSRKESLYRLLGLRYSPPPEKEKEAKGKC